MLLTQKAIAEGYRALALLYAQQMDIERFGDDDSKHKAKNVISFLTLIVKGFMTDMATVMSNLGVQVYGGHGFIREWGMEQLVRDARIAQLYEGTNGIQALDLISRKLARDKGTMLEDTFALFNSKIEQMTNADNQVQATALLAEWFATTTELRQLNTVNLARTGYDFMHYSAYCLLAVIWSRSK